LLLHNNFEIIHVAIILTVGVRFMVHTVVNQRSSLQLSD